MVGLSRLAGGGLLLLLALLPLALDGKPAPPPQALHKAPAGGTTALRRDLTEQQAPEGSSGPAAGRSGSKAGNAAPTPPKGKGAASASASAASQLVRDLRPDSKQSRAAWGRMVHPEHHAGGGGGGGGGGGSRRLKGLAKKGLAKGCFGLKLDRIGSMSGLGC
ncbi:putative C-type natriuretic peptide 1d protein [Naja naja]|nr:putative C-type natriuretic peptide 1d protein [Naja naja]